MRLHNGCVAIAVDDKTGKIVAFAMHKTEHIVVLTSNKTYGSTHIPRRLKTGYPEVGVNLNIAEREHSHGNAANLVVSVADKVALVVVNGHQVTFFYVVHASNCPRENPGVESLERFLFASL